MRNTARFFVLALAAVMMMAFAVAPASAQVDQEGLVNVNVGDANVQLPVTAAANVCNIAVGVLAQQVQDGNNECDAEARGQAINRGGNGGGNVNQDGLVNVNVGDVNVQLPITAAANVCNVAVGVLAEQIQDGNNECFAQARGQAINR
jgi:DNA-binding protein